MDKISGNNLTDEAKNLIKDNKDLFARKLVGIADGINTDDLYAVPTPYWDKKSLLQMYGSYSNLIKDNAGSFA